MLFRLLGFAALFALAACSPDAGMTAARSDSQMRQATVRLQFSEQPEAHGSGVIVAPGLVMTAKHVAEEARKHADAGFEALFADGSRQPVLPLWQSEDDDLAIMSVAGTWPWRAEISCAAPNIGAPVSWLGSPFRFGDGVLYRGIVAQGAGDKSEHGVMLAGQVAPGSSGGPVYDGSFALVGVVSAGGALPVRAPFPASSMAPTAGSCGALQAFLDGRPGSGAARPRIFRAAAEASNGA